MKHWKHLSFDQRKVINSFLSKKVTLKEIAFIIDYDPTAISKEIKRNRLLLYPQKRLTHKVCEKLLRFPYVCNHCDLRYKETCPFDKYKYDPKYAQRCAQERLVLSRRGLDLDSQEFNDLDNAVKEGNDNKESIYHISQTDKRITKSTTTIYRYINMGYLKTKRMDLPYAVSYKKRKHNKKYDYKDNYIDRSSHTYLDYLSYRHNHPNEYGWQLDFLGAIKTDTKVIITLTMPDLHFSLLNLINKPNSDKIVEFFNNLEISLGTEDFIKVFPYILTDRDPCFSDIEGIEFSPITGERRTHIFYCDPYVSRQKGNIENINKQIRKFFPKGHSINGYSQKDVRDRNMILIKSHIRSLDGASPEEAMEKVYGKEILNKLMK